MNESLFDEVYIMKLQVLFNVFNYFLLSPDEQQLLCLEDYIKVVLPDCKKKKNTQCAVHINTGKYISNMSPLFLKPLINQLV